MRWPTLAVTLASAVSQVRFRAPARTGTVMGHCVGPLSAPQRVRPHGVTAVKNGVNVTEKVLEFQGYLHLKGYGHRVRVGFLEVSNFYKIRPIFKGEQLLQNKDFDCRRQLLQKIEEIEENLPFFSKFSSDFSNFYQIRVGPGTKSNFYKISLESRINTTFTK